jgi:hypothetical protein
MSRRSRRAKKEADLKEAIALQKRYRSWLKKPEGTWVELPEPIRAGWERYFVVRPDVQRGPEGPMYDRILRLVQHVEYSNRKDFAERDWRRGNKRVTKPHVPHRADLATYNAMTPEMQKHFILSVEKDDKGRLQGPVYELVHPWKLQSRIRPSYITHRLIPDGDVASEDKWVRDRMRDRGHWGRLDHHFGNAYHDWYREDPDELRAEYDLKDLGEPVVGKYLQRAVED